MLQIKQKYIFYKCNYKALRAEIIKNWWNKKTERIRRTWYYPERKREKINDYQKKIGSKL